MKPAAEPTASQVNEHGQSIDSELIRKNRNLFIATGVIQNVGAGFGMSFPTKLIRMFGGGDQHIGLLGSITSLGSVFQFLGALFLRKTRSDRKAFILIWWAMFISGAIGLFAIFSYYLPWSKQNTLYLYILTLFLGTTLLAIVQNVETTWIGDLVPGDKRGWFVGTRLIWINLTAFLSTILLGKLGDKFLTPKGFGLMMVVPWVLMLAIIFCYTRITDREPKNLNFFAAGASHHERLHYTSFALWCYIAFYSFWAFGRAILFTFNTIFLMEEFHFTMSKLAWITALQIFLSMVTVYIFGKISDKRGNRMLLIIISGFIALCMFLWVGAAWWGIAAIIAYYVINAAAGLTHGMLGTNLGLEIFPDKGRAAYVAFSRFFIGLAGFASPVVAGWVMHLYADVNIVLLGKTLNRYYLAFGTGAAVTFCCIIPLILMGRRKVGD